MINLKIILFVFIINFLNLFFSQNLFTIVLVCSIVNIYFFTRSKTNQNQINKLTAIELFGWIINTYLVLINNFNLWFLALNNLLWLLTSIKLIESKNNIKSKNIIILLLLCVGTNALFNLSFISNFINLFCIALLIYSLLLINDYKSKNFIKQIFILVLFIPLTLFSYIVIPKPKPWLNINSQTTASTGINNELKPGDISSLAKNNDLVGRVFFDTKLPNKEERYWRVFVLDQFKDNTWSGSSKKDIRLFLNNSSVGSIQSNLNKYKSENWILEPNYIKERPWSGYGTPVEKKLIITKKGKLIGLDKLKKRKEYQISQNKNSWRLIPPTNKKYNIDENNKKIYKLGKKWEKESISQEEILYKAEKFFKEGGYKYSINPGLMNQNSPYDDFLFNKKSGFCEHYAGSFTLLMNNANIPARVVVGYQGGELLKSFENKNYLLIDSSYAHAWSEVWIKGKGWIRIDPTLWIAPERIQDSLLFTKNKFILQKFTQNFKLNFINNLSRFEIRFKGLTQALNVNNQLFNFSENLILNRIIAIIIFTLILSFTLLILLFLDKRSNYNLYKMNISIYLYFVSKYKFKIYRGETLSSISNRLAKQYPKISNKINNIQLLYNAYKFKNNFASQTNFFKFFSRLLYLEVIVIIHIGLEKIKYYNKKLGEK